MTGPPPELFANSLEGAGYLPCKTRPVSSLGADQIPILGPTTSSLNRPLATMLSEMAWVLVRTFDYSAHGGCVPPTKTISDWWPILARHEYISVRGDYVSTHRSKTQLTLFGEAEIQVCTVG